MTEKHMSLISHLEELRLVLVRVFLSLIPTTILGWYLRNDVLDLLVKPLREISPGFKLSTLGIVSPFFVYLKIAMAVGFVIALPYILYQIWSFVLPALKAKEKQALGTIVPASVILFVVGIGFAYFTVFQVGLKFFWAFAESSNIQQIYGMDEYLSFCIAFLLPFGLIFELPIVVLVLAKMGLVSPKFLASKRRYALLIIFVIAAVLTPGPDIISQVMMAAPMYILFEISIFLARFVYKPNLGDSEDDEEDDKEEAMAAPTVEILPEADMESVKEFSSHPPDAILEYHDEEVEYVSVYTPTEKPKEEASEASQHKTGDQTEDVSEVDLKLTGEERLAQLLGDIQQRGLGKDNQDKQ